MPISYSACSSDCIPRPSSRGPASASRRSAGSSTGTAAGSGPRARSTKGRRSTSLCDGSPASLEALVNPGTILLVEDNPDDVALTMRAFKSNNITNDVVVAQDGVQALDYLFGADGKAAVA